MDLSYQSPGQLGIKGAMLVLEATTVEPEKKETTNSAP